MPQISIIICTHNPREDYLKRVLGALRAQTLPPTDWELLLVDNASEKPLTAQIDLSWHPNARHVREEKTGLTHARLCGIAASRGELLIFVDDDNLLRKDYLETCLKISAAHPHLGTWGGSCIPEFEVEPPAELRPWLGGLVIEKLTDSVWAKLQRGSEATPPGAGMVVRRKVALHYREQVSNDAVRQALDRSGNKLGSGGDGDLGLCGLAFDLGTGRFPELELIHLIPAKRLTLEYLEGIHEGFGHAAVITGAVHQPQGLPKEPQWGSAQIWIKKFLWRMAGKSRVERRLRVAEEKGKLKAYQTLKQLSPK